MKVSWVNNILQKNKFAPKKITCVNTRNVNKFQTQNDAKKYMKNTIFICKNIKRRRNFIPKISSRCNGLQYAPNFFFIFFFFSTNPRVGVLVSIITTKYNQSSSQRKNSTEKKTWKIPVIQVMLLIDQGILSFFWNPFVSISIFFYYRIQQFRIS